MVYFLSDCLKKNRFLLITMAKGFYLDHSWLWCIHQFQISYFSSANLKNFLASRDINKPLLHVKFQTDWVEITEDRRDLKLMSDSASGVWCKEVDVSKNPRPISDLIIFLPRPIDDDTIRVNNINPEYLIAMKYATWYIQIFVNNSLHNWHFKFLESLFCAIFFEIN